MRWHGARRRHAVFGTFTVCYARGAPAKMMAFALSRSAVHAAHAQTLSRSDGAVSTARFPTRLTVTTSPCCSTMFAARYNVKSHAGYVHAVR